MNNSNNYIIEDGFDFYKELNGASEDNEDNANSSSTLKENHCMISHEKLTHNSIKLPCGHTFNYMPLYIELRLHIKYNSIECPYCRTTHEKLIPYIALPNVAKVLGVNHPKKRCMKGPTCNWKLKTGKCCNKNAIECASGIFCDKHKLLHAAAVNKTVEKDEIMPWTAEMTEMLKAKSVIELKKQLRSAGLTIGGNKRTLIQRIFKNNNK